MQSLFVIDGNFFAGIDIAQGEEENMPVQILHVGVRFAAVIDVMCAVAAAAAVQTPPAIDVANAKDSSVASALRCFKVRDALASVFGDLPATGKGFGGKAPFAVDSRFPDGKARCEIQFHQRQ